MNNPLNAVDPTGMMTDFIDYQTGERTHIDDHKDQVITASTKQIKQFADYWNKGNGNPDYRKEYYSSLGKLESRWNNLNLTVAQFDRLAQAVYAESSGGARESYGIVNVLENRAAAEETDLMTRASAEPGYRVNGVNSNAYFTEEGSAADQKRRNIHIGIARAIPDRTSLTELFLGWSRF
ncbi:MAG: hypothetical protein IPK58_19165 [Acidobacteria bacterium]|nr:hypothetical protein [Acidobacteriota bacterium]